MIAGSVTATRGGQRISVPKMIGLAYSDRVEFPSWATYYDGRNTLFGDLTLRVGARSVPWRAAMASRRARSQSSRFVTA